jgi:hypothetical protein
MIIGLARTIRQAKVLWHLREMRVVMVRAITLLSMNLAEDHQLSTKVRSLIKTPLEVFL